MSETIREVKEVEEALTKFNFDPDRKLLRIPHLKYVLSSLKSFGRSIIGYDYAHPWIFYYIVHTSIICGSSITTEDRDSIKLALKYCWNEKVGGFGGGYKQLPHLAPTYAAFLCILELGESAFDLLDKEGLTKFFWACKKGGKFQMTPGAEEDNRGAYIVSIIIKLLKLDEKLLEGVAEELIKTQTHEGGMSNVPGGEAHGGYTFCGVAALAVLGRLHELDVSRLIFWLSRRQCEFGGFNGRTNKLLDSCYSFWVGSTFHVIDKYFEKKVNNQGKMLFSEENLIKYIIFFCQNTEGGLWDKPGKKRDLYHTCYSLSGLSLAQENNLLHPSNETSDIDPIYNV